MVERSASAESWFDVFDVLSRFTFVLLLPLPELFARFAAYETAAYPTSENTEMNIAPPNRVQKCVSTWPGIPELPREFVPGLSILAIVLSGLRTRVHNTNTRF